MSICPCVHVTYHSFQQAHSLQNYYEKSCLIIFSWEPLWLLLSFQLCFRHNYPLLRCTLQFDASIAKYGGTVQGSRFESVLGYGHYWSLSRAVYCITQIYTALTNIPIQDKDEIWFFQMLPVASVFAFHLIHLYSLLSFKFENWRVTIFNYFHSNLNSVRNLRIRSI